MTKLIKNELSKIFRKKSMLIAAILIILIILLVNILVKRSDNNHYNNYYSKEYLAYIDERLSELKPKNSADNAEYIELKTIKETAELSNKYSNDSWQKEVIATTVNTAIQEVNTYRYALTQDEEATKKAEEKYNKLVEYLQKDEWKFFAEEELAQIETQITEVEKSKKLMGETSPSKEMAMQDKMLALQKKVATWRVEKEIPYGDNYFNTILNKYQSFAMQAASEESGREEEYGDKKQRQQIEKMITLYEYDIENQTKTQETENARGMLLISIDSDGYEIIILVVLIMVAGVMISEEFSKGTIKLLLVRPYKRTTILAAKFITCLIMIAITMLFVLGMQFIIGGVIFGFDSLATPVVDYDFTSNQIINMNIITSIALTILGKLPIYLLLITLSFALSTITTNSPLAIAFPLLGYMGSSIINMLAEQFKLEWVKFFVTPNWDLSQYLFGGLPMFESMTFTFSVLICVVYLVAMLVPTFIVFKKKNIKNI